MTMSTQKTIRVTVERDRVWIIRQCGLPARSWCEHCRAAVDVVSVEQATALSGATAEAIRSRTGPAKIHAISAASAENICLPSLLETMGVARSVKAIQKT